MCAVFFLSFVTWDSPSPGSCRCVMYVDTQTSDSPRKKAQLPGPPALCPIMVAFSLIHLFGFSVFPSELSLSTTQRAACSQV